MRLVRTIAVITLTCLHFAAGAQRIILTKAQVLNLPCVILKNTKGDLAWGYFNVKDSSIYSCREVFQRTLAGGYAQADTLNCAGLHLKPMLKNTCPVNNLGSIVFRPNSVELAGDAKYLLAAAAKAIAADTICGVKVVGYTADSTSKKAYQLSWDRVNAVIKYLVEQQHVPLNVILFSYDTWGTANTLDLLPATVGVRVKLKDVKDKAAK